MKEKKFNLLLTLKKLKKNKSIIGLNNLNKEKEKLNDIEKSLTELLNHSKLPKNEVLTSGLIRQISNYQKLIQNKLDTSKNRKKYINNEISDGLSQLVKINKQTDTIKKKIDSLNREDIELKEEKSKITLTHKPAF